MEAIIRAQGARFGGVILAALVQVRRVLMSSAHRDPVFGPVVVVGDGGNFMDVIRDTALLLPPFGSDEVNEALHSLRIAPLFAGVRGEPAMDTEALARALVAIGQLMIAQADVMSVDLNPVLINDAGAGVMVVDAVVFRAAEQVPAD